MTRGRHVVFLATALMTALVVLTSSCSSSTDPTGNGNYVEVGANDPASQTEVAATDTSGATASDTPAVDAGEAPVGGDELDEVDQVVAVFDDFLTLRAQAITGAVELNELEPIATEAAIAQVAELRAENDTRIANDSYAALSDLAEWSNISRVDQIGDQLVFRDCTEQQYLTPGGFTVVNFVTNDVLLVDDGGRLKVAGVTMVQDGVVSLSPEALGCIPPSFAQRAELTSERAVTEAARLIQDPGAALDQGLPDLYADQARADLEFGLQSLNTAGLSRTADELVSYEVLGLDVNQPDFTAVVAVCRTYPTGRSYVDRDGEQTTTEVPIGSSYEEWVYVHLSIDGSSDRVVAVEDRGPNCEGR